MDAARREGLAITANYAQGILVGKQVFAVCLKLERIDGAWYWQPQNDERRSMVEQHREAIAQCVGCANYHGKAYGGNFLFCGIHPTGPDGGECGDRITFCNA